MGGGRYTPERRDTRREEEEGERRVGTEREETGVTGEAEAEGVEVEADVTLVEMLSALSGEHGAEDGCESCWRAIRRAAQTFAERITMGHSEEEERQDGGRKTETVSAPRSPETATHAKCTTMIASARGKDGDWYSWPTALT
jgi:hypothetical protein